MKVNFEEIQKDVNTPSKQNKTKQTQDFQKLLENKLSHDGTKINPQSITDTSLELSSIEAAIKLQSHQPSKIMEKLDKSLDMWEKYSHFLSMNNLKQSQETLDEILDNLSSLDKDESSQNKEVENIVSEMKIMAMAEKARLLRGDYS